jgi:hypothetical protein
VLEAALRGEHGAFAVALDRAALERELDPVPVHVAGEAARGHEPGDEMIVA